VTEDRAEGRRQFRRGVLIGVFLMGLIVYLAAAGLAPGSAARTAAALEGAGVRLDPRFLSVPQHERHNLMCTALNVLMESRGEPERGQMAVAWVTRTRADERDLSACQVVYERSQFSWTVYSQKRIRSAVLGDPDGWAEAMDVAWRVMIEGERDPTAGANHFYAHRSVRPAWAGLAAKGSRVVIGGHTFLRIGPRSTPERIWQGRVVG
jgi:N-acetylmuramoyl-L-alanine amidase